MFKARTNRDYSNFDLTICSGLPADDLFKRIQNMEVCIEPSKCDSRHCTCAAQQADMTVGFFSEFWLANPVMEGLHNEYVELPVQMSKILMSEALPCSFSSWLVLTDSRLLRL